MKKTIAILILFYSIESFSQNSEKQDNNKIYDTSGIDVKPTFSGGQEKLNSYINENFSKVGFETKAKVFALFVIEKDGSLSDIKILCKVKLDSSKSEELIGILKSMPKWNPGIQNGQIVRVLYSIPLLKEIK